MSHLYLSESSRRTQTVSDETMDANWERAFGKPKKQTCTACGNESPITKNGLCSDCRAQGNTTPKPSVCCQCLKNADRLNSIGQCDDCAAMQIEQGDVGHGE